ncbi:MAG: hypothetical protein R3E04_06630 [Sphingobium sp.]
MQLLKSIVAWVVCVILPATIVWRLWDGGLRDHNWGVSFSKPADAQPSELSAPSFFPTNDTNIWKLSEDADPMTDDRITVAQRDYPISNGAIELRIECKSNGLLTYRFTAFNSDGTGSSFDGQIGPNSAGNYGRYIRFSVRIDSEDGYKIVKLSSPFTEFDNQFVFQSRLTDPRLKNGPGYNSFKSHLTSATMDMLATAPTLRFQIPVVTGKEVLQVDQSDPTVQSVIKGCLLD